MTQSQTLTFKPLLKGLITTSKKLLKAPTHCHGEIKQNVKENTEPCDMKGKQSKYCSLKTC